MYLWLSGYGIEFSILVVHIFCCSYFCYFHYLLSLSLYYVCCFYLLLVILEYVLAYLLVDYNRCHRWQKWNNNDSHLWKRFWISKRMLRIGYVRIYKVRKGLWWDNWSRLGALGQFLHDTWWPRRNIVKEFIGTF